MGKKNNKNETKLTYKDITIDEIKQELKKEKFKSRYVKVLMSTVYTLIIVASVAALIATLIMPVLQISGTSMEPTLNEGEIVLALKTKNIKAGDVIAFYHGNKILVKRVIATSGQWVKITDEGDVYVDGKLVNEPYVKEKSLGQADVKFPIQVSEGSYFILGDDRETSIDSRTEVIGSISQEDIIGKVLIKAWPIKQIGVVK